MFFELTINEMFLARLSSCKVHIDCPITSLFSGNLVFLLSVTTSLPQ